MRPLVYSNMLRRTLEQLVKAFGLLKHATSNATMNAKLEIAQIWPKSTHHCFRLHLVPSMFEIVVRQSRMASYISRNSSSEVCHSTRLVSHSDFTLPTPTSFKPSRFLRMLISSVDCPSRRCLLSECLKNIARACRVDVMFCT